MLQLAVLSSCGCTCRTDRWEERRGSINAFVLGPCHHKLLPASAFGSCCITVRNEIPPFSSVAKTTVPWPSTPFSTSWPSSVVLSNCSPSSARWGSASTRGIIVDASFYATTPSPKQCSRLFTSVESFTLHINIVLDIPTSAAVYTVIKTQQSNGSICSTVQCFFVPRFQRHLVCKHIQQVVKVIWHKAASPPHTDGSVAFASWRQCAPHIQKAKKWLPRQRPLCALSAFCRSTTQTSSINNCLVAIVLTKPVIAILVPKLVATATTLKHSISTIFSSDRLTPKTHP